MSGSAGGGAGALPLPLAPFERYMFADDRPTHPMTFVIRLRVSGRFDPQRWRSACAAALPGHPLLGAVLRGMQWLPAEPRALPIAEAPAEDPAGIDLAAAPGWRMALGPEAIAATFHHSCCDALGALDFLEDVLLHYADPALPPALPPTAEALRNRARLRVGWLAHLRRSPWDVGGTLRFLATTPTPLAAPRVPLAEASDAVFLPLRPTPRGERGATVNDLLLRELFAAVFAWNRTHGAPGMIRLAVPTNLRALGGAGRTACNVVSMVFIQRPADADAPAAGFLQQLSEETAGLRRRNQGLCLLRMVAVAAAVPGGLRTLLGEGCRSTAALSNLGAVWRGSPLAGPDGKLRFGAATLERIEFLPPVRPNTRVALGAVGYAGELSLAIRHDAAALGPHAGPGLLADFARRLRLAPGLGAG